MANTKNKNKSLDEIREKFFSLLLKRPCTRKQAEDFLWREADSQESCVNLLMTEAEDMGLINDLTYAKLFIDGHLSWGNAKIKYELTSRGIDREEISAALDEAQDEISRASELIESWRKTGLPDKKITTRLLNRGFSGKSIREAL